MYNYVGGGTGTTERGRGCVVALLQGSAPLSGCSPGLQGSSLQYRNLPCLTWCYQDLILLRPAAPTHTTRQYYDSTIPDPDKIEFVAGVNVPDHGPGLLGEAGDEGGVLYRERLIQRRLDGDPLGVDHDGALHPRLLA